MTHPLGEKKGGGGDGVRKNEINNQTKCKLMIIILGKV